MGPAFFVALAVFGLSIVVFSLSETFWLSLLALGVYGGADMVSVYIRQTLVQIATPDGMRGRVSAVNSVAINASNELGDFRAGAMAGGIGTVPSVLVGGLARVASTALWRSEERRVGKECVSTCRSRGSPDHEKKKTVNRC